MGANLAQQLKVIPQDTIPQDTASHYGANIYCYHSGTTLRRRSLIIIRGVANKWYDIGRDSLTSPLLEGVRVVQPPPSLISSPPDDN